MKREPLILLAVFVASLFIQLFMAADVGFANYAFAAGYRFGSAIGKATHLTGYAAIALILYRRLGQHRIDQATIVESR